MDEIERQVFIDDFKYKIIEVLSKNEDIDSIYTFILKESANNV